MKIWFGRIWKISCVIKRKQFFFNYKHVLNDKTQQMFLIALLNDCDFNNNVVKCFFGIVELMRNIHDVIM